MKYVDVKENLNTIISMVEKASEYIVLVSPFSDLSGSWGKLKNAINDATKRGVKVDYYVCEGDGYTGIEGINVNLYEVPKLHAKMFFSEKDALISSGNLSSRPDINWVCKLETKEEFNELRSFFENYIQPNATLYN